ncbi:MAG: hypothetical protein KDB23_29255 [Planctomycetales bacterium]|nr:hypothetical protein [Planctomycetales bacterium]
MSETTISFVPLDPYSSFQGNEIAQIRNFLVAENSNAIVLDSISVETFGKVQFIDCGANLKHIKCARCGDEIENGVWRDAMTADVSEDSGFKLETTLKCPKCKFVSKLHGLSYKEHCAFASARISVRVHSHFWSGWLLHIPWIGIVEARY